MTPPNSTCPPRPLHRRDFMSLLGVLGLGALVGCTDEPSTSGSYDGDTLIIGAGAAGMSAAHFLVQAGANVTVLEAAATYGGRIKTNRDFVDFPIPLGGEWLHTEEDELANVTGTDDPGIEMASYGEVETHGLWKDGALLESEIESSTDLKFVGRTWLDVFDEFIVPPIVDHMQFGVSVTHIDSSQERIVVSTGDGRTFEADKVIVTVPIVQLRDHLTFTPDLPRDRRAALNNAKVWGGFKAFFEFSERFYPSLIELDGQADSDGEQLYYDAAYGQATTRHVLGLFTVGTEINRYQDALARDELLEFVLAELDPMFGGKPSATYVQHIAQDWNAEPHIGMAYLADDADWRTPRSLADPIDGRLFFAGDAYINDIEGWSMVHLAARSGRRAVDRILS